MNITSIQESNFTTGNNSTLKNNSRQIIAFNYILVIIIGILAVCFNGLLLIAMLRNKVTIFITNYAYLVANLAIADLLTGVNAVRYGCMQEESTSVFLDKLLLSLFWASVQASLLTTFVMSFERYVAIVYPFKATNWLTKKRTLQSIVVIWLLSCINGALKTIYDVNDIMTFVVTLLFELTVLVTIVLYYRIFLVLAVRKRALQVQLGSLAASLGIPLRKELQRECQLTHVVALLTAIMIVTVLPYLIGGQIFLSYKLFSASHDSSSLPSIHQFLNYYFPVELTNFLINPCVYAWRLPKYRHALLRTLKCCPTNY